jgi:hypothetical protein
MSAADRPYNNPATREEKAEALRNEKRLKQEREPTTLHALSRLGQDEEGSGRFAPDRYVTGSQAATKYPRQDNASPWSGSGADPGVEPSLGYPIDQMENCGEAFEIEKSLAASSDPALSQRVRTGVEDDGAASDLAEDTAIRHAVNQRRTHTDAPSSAIPLAGDCAPLEVHNSRLECRDAPTIPPTKMKRRKIAWR